MGGMTPSSFFSTLYDSRTGQQFRLESNGLYRELPFQFLDQGIKPTDSPFMLKAEDRNDLFEVFRDEVRDFARRRPIRVSHVTDSLGASVFAAEGGLELEGKKVEMTAMHLVGVWNENPGGENAARRDIRRRLEETFGSAS
jgi:hypothetical protein